MKKKKKNREDKTRQKYVNIGSEKPWRIDPGTSRMQSGRSTICANPPEQEKVTVIVYIEIFTWSILGYLVDNQVQ